MLVPGVARSEHHEPSRTEMENPTYIALSRLIAQQNAMDVVAGNLANASTPGYHSERTLFSDWLSRQSGTDVPRGGETIAFTQDRATYRDHQQGTFSQTGNPLDLAIGGDGYFTVNTASGPRLTRAGRFTLTPNGVIADSAGNPLLDTNGQPLQVAAADTNLTVAADGTISSENGPIGKIGIVMPNDVNQMQAEGDRLFSVASPTSAVAQPRIVQGAVEDSNVQPILETVRMMDIMREFQFVTQFVDAESQRQQNAIDKITQTSSG